MGFRIYAICLPYPILFIFDRKYIKIKLSLSHLSLSSSSSSSYSAESWPKTLIIHSSFPLGVHFTIIPTGRITHLGINTGEPSALCFIGWVHYVTL